jgi:hypothetical protein
MSRRALHLAVVLGSVALCAARAGALEVDEDEALGFERTPPRLGYVEGDVSYWRPGAEDWSPARVNTPLAAGDELFVTDEANLELEVGPGGFVRAGEQTQLAVASLEPDFLQLRVTEGRLSLDLRRRRSGQTFEIDTPNAAFTIEHTGYYRVEVDGEDTTFTSRRGGRATVTAASGVSAAIAPSEQVVVTGADAASVESYSAPDLDAWDRWNYARSDRQVDPVSSRYVTAGVYGVHDLDHYGDWRVVPSYGALWVPRSVAVGWVPYSSGRWFYDPYYGWTWIDDAPWGWAPFHYGRWVYVSGYWGWCPGPLVTRAYYAPALVAFYGGSGVSIGYGGPGIAWVPLGWGEPLIPWWGSARFRRYPRWGGWGGPRVVNQVVVTHDHVIEVNQIKSHENLHVRNAVVRVDRDHFGRHTDRSARFAHGDAKDLAPLHGVPPVQPDRTSLVADPGRASKPPAAVFSRRVVATREPRPDPLPDFSSAKLEGPAQASPRVREPEPRAAAPAPRIVEPPREGKRIKVSTRPPFGSQADGERKIPPPAPRFGEIDRKSAPATPSAPAQPQATPVQTERPARVKPEPSRAQPQAPRVAPEPRTAQPRTPRVAPEPRTVQPQTPRVAPQPRTVQPQTPRVQPEPARVRVAPEAPRAGAPAVREPAAVVRPSRTPGAGRAADTAPATRALPGEPANRVYQGPRGGGGAHRWR